MTNKEKINKLNDVEAGELIADNCYDNILRGSCCSNCGTCFSIWLSREVEENEVKQSD